MNIRVVLYTIGKMLMVEAALMALPVITAVIYRENEIFSFIFTAVLLLLTGLLLTYKKPKNTNLFAKEGLLIVALTWISISIFGAIPFVLSGTIPSFLNAVFETVSGFTTTGATVVMPEGLPVSILFWRSFTHWIGGMGVLVFVLAILPQPDTHSMHLMRAEVPGPNVGKLVSKIKLTARILYGIYVLMTVIETVLLITGGMSFMDALLHSFSTAGTGGFSTRNAGIAAFGSTYIQVIISVFMMLFGINFNVFYFIVIGKFAQVIKERELHIYLAIMASSTALVAINIMSLYDKFGYALRDSFFQVSAIMTTTGFGGVNYDLWPPFAQAILVLLMFLGSSAGSTGGGIKTIRIIIILKNAAREVKRMIFPKSVMAVKINDKVIENSAVSSVSTFMTVYIIIFTVSVLLVCASGVDILTSFGASASCINNVGPALGIVGSNGYYAMLPAFAKLVLIFDMLAGRLELFPMLVLLSPTIWLKK